MIINYNTFQILLERELLDWFVRYETTRLATTWGEVQQAFISQFSEICSEGQVATTLRYANQKNYEFVKDYYDRFL
jgi:hypothetical protein